MRRAASAAKKGAPKRIRRARKSSGLPVAPVVATVLAASAGTAVYLGYFRDSSADDSTTDPFNPAKEGAGTFAGYIHNLLDTFRGTEEEGDSKLLPDYENSIHYQEEGKPPLTLVLDLEETLGTSTWDRKHGWRFVKRPGLDRFLVAVNKFGYEVVIFSTNPSIGLVEDTVNLLDPKSQLIPYKLYCNHATFKDERYVKDLTALNRDPSRVVVVDDNLLDVMTHKENCIGVKPFDDIEDVEDDTLDHLGQFLTQLGVMYLKGHIKDVRPELKKFQPTEGADSDDKSNFVDNFVKHQNRIQNERQVASKQGLGGLIRTMLPETAPKASETQHQLAQPTPAANNLLALNSAAAPEANTGTRKYRKTVWERLTDESSAQQQDKEMREANRQWVAHMTDYKKTQLRQK